MDLRRPLLALAVLAALVAPSACAAPDDVTDAPMIQGPASKALESDDPSCKTDADCAQGEQCTDGVCQMQRCSSKYHSAPPLGKRSYFAVDRELVVLDDEKHSLDGYEPTNGSFAHPDRLSIGFGTDRIIDEAGGNFSGSRPEGMATAIEGKSSIVVVTGDTRTEIPVGFVPVAIAAGDIEGDGTDEIVAVSREGAVAICSVPTKRCTRRSVDGVTAKDIALADVYGEGHAVPIVLADKPSGTSFVFVLNDGGPKAAHPAIDEIDTGHTAQRIAAGDIDHAGSAEIVTLEDGGYGDFVGDTLRVFGVKDNKLAELGSKTIAKDAIDVFAGDIDGDDKSELLVLESSGIEVFDVESPTSMKTSFKTALTASTRPSRIAMADLDGDSPAGTLLGEAELVAGPVVPISVLVYPPYSRTRSDGTSQIGLGSRESKSDVAATTVTLKASLALGYEFGFPGLAKVSLGGRVEGALARTNAAGTSVSVGDRFTVDARPELEGPDNGVAVLACACYHAYTYAVEDPSGRLGSRDADKKKMSLFVPVGGQTALWSLKRYNALAKHLGNLPTVNVPYAVGDPSSYPTKMVKLDGKPIPEKDLVFTTPRSYRTSDVARTGWELAVGDSNAQTDAQTIGVGVRATLRVGPVFAEADVGVSKTDAYTVTVGREASFSGSVPPIRDDVRTPEDEHELYSYGFSPIVYRDHYKSESGEGGLFVVTYAVTP
jgi:hypothetical protein